MRIIKPVLAIIGAFTALMVVAGHHRVFLHRSQEAYSITSLEELNALSVQDSLVVVMKPGLYRLTDFLTPDSMLVRRENGIFPFMDFSGNHNHFILNGVVIEVDTELRNILRPPIHTPEFLFSGNSNTIEGLEIIYKGNGTSPGGSAFAVAGEGNTLKDVRLTVRGSFPYGYGDLFGKGGPDVIRHHKHSGIQITGSHTTMLACSLYMRSFGHGYYIQGNANHVHFEDCYVEGEMRSTNDILSETSGPAYGVNFRTWTVNREGEYRVTPGYMKSLCEDGFRTYRQNENITFINCTAVNTRGGFELRTNGGVSLKGCTVIGTERGFWVGNDAVLEDCRGDARHGPLLFVEGSRSKIDIAVLPDETDHTVHALATIQGQDNIVKLRRAGENDRSQKIPILIGYTHPDHGESMSPYHEGPAGRLKLLNETSMPVVLGRMSADSEVISRGMLIEDQGMNNHFSVWKEN